MQIDGGLAFTGAEITGPGTKPRHLDAYRAAVFAQSVLAYAIATKVTHQPPPANAAIYRVDVTGTWNAPEISTRPIFYASDGKQAFIAAPAPGATPATADWWIAPPRVMEAFAGTAQLVPTAGTQTESPTPSTSEPVDDKSSSGGTSGSSWLWIAVVAAVVAVIAALGIRARNRARQSA